MSELKARPEKVLLEQMIKDQKSVEEIASKTKYTPQYIRKIRKKIQMQTAPTPPTTKATDDKIQKITVTPIQTSEGAEITTKETDIKKEPIEEYDVIFTPEDVSQIFKTINASLGKYKPKVDNSDQLGKLGYKPINRLIDKYGFEDADLLIFGGFVLMTYAPSVALIIQDKTGKPKEEKKQEEKANV